MLPCVLFYSVLGTGSLGAVRAAGSLYERSPQLESSTVTTWYIQPLNFFLPNRDVFM